MSPNFYSAAKNGMNRISKGMDLDKRAGGSFKGQRRKDNNVNKARVGAFTLIELLAVIAIIALLAGLVLGTAGLATRKARESRMTGQKEKLVTAIEQYKLEMGNFPPDNQDKTQRDADFQTDRHIKAGMNSLFYELSGCTFDSAAGGTFTTQNQAQSVKAADLRSELGVRGIENSARAKKDIPFHHGVNFRPSEFDTAKNGINILIAPLPGPYDKHFQAYDPKTLQPTPKILNPWFYDASTTNRHNIETYDIWTEYTSGKDNKVIGNWKE
jgi:prepilin-type N-terminal cleavage/methylation domain-containing protein